MLAEESCWQVVFGAGVGVFRGIGRRERDLGKMIEAFFGAESVGDCNSK